MSPSSSLTVLSLAILLASCRTTGPQAAAVPPPLAPVSTSISASNPIRDNEIRNRFSDELGKLHEAKQTTACSVLNTQCKERHTCSLTVPSARTGVCSPEQIYARCRPSTLIVGGVYKCGKCSRWHGNMASGYAVTADTIATNYHVVNTDKSDCLGVMTADGITYPIVEILAADEDADAALARIAIPAGSPGLSPAPLTPDAPVGSRIAVISHPTSQFFTFTEGIISRYSVFRRSKQAREVSRMTITADFAKGSSGGPVFDAAGNVCGMVSSTNSIYYNDDEHGNPVNLQMVIKTCVPATAVLELITTPIR